MKALTFATALVLLPILSTGSTLAQDCTQTYVPPNGDHARTIVFDASLGLFTHLSRPPYFAAEVDVYEKNPGSGAFELIQTLSPEERRPGESFFGDRSATDGNVIAMTSENLTIQGELSSLYIFERNQTTRLWEQAARIAPLPNATSDQFSGGVAVSGNRVVVGAPYEQGDGRVYVIERDPVTGVWDYAHVIEAPRGVPASWFGYSLDLEGDRLVVGDLYGGAGVGGTAHVYEYSAVFGLWNYEQTLAPTGLDFQAQYALNVDLEGDRIIVGARGQDMGPQASRGGAYIWQRNPATNDWNLAATLETPFPGLTGSSGEFVQLDGDNAYYTVPWVQVTPGGSRGALMHYRYDSSTQDWIAQPPIQPEPALGVSYWAFIAEGGFGADGGTLMYAGERSFETYYFFTGESDQDCDGNGLADRCEINSGTGIDLNGNGLLDVCEGIGTAYCRQPNPNSAGHEALLSVDGSLFVQENSVTLRASQMPPGQFGYALNSPYQGVIPNVGGSQGSLCIFGPSLGRHNRAGEVRYSGAAGEFDLTVDLTHFPSPMGSILVQAGETWNFQVWYRDQNPSSTSNLTHAVSLTFQ